MSGESVTQQRADMLEILRCYTPALTAPLKRSDCMRGLSTLILALVFASGASAASVDGLKIHSASTGSGKATLVLVHGWTCDATSWDAQVPGLAKQYRVITLASPRPG